MRERICTALAEDDELIRLNDLRKEELLSRHSDKDRERMRQRFADLMERLKSGVDASTAGKGDEEGGRPPGGTKAREPLGPLPTRDAPTFLRIGNVTRPIPVRLDRQALIRLESDAPDGYLTSHIHAKLAVVCEPAGALVLSSRSDFHGGRARLAVRPGDGAKPQEGSIRVFLFTPDEHTYADESRFLLENPPEQATAGEKRKAHVKVPEPIPVFQPDWPRFGWDESNVAEAREDKEGGKIYVNADNRHLAKLLRGGGYQEKGISRMRNNFVLYVAFYAWARHAQVSAEYEHLSGREFEDYQNGELDRVAQTVIHSIAAGARLADED